jgi:uncharacterized membrane protein YdcZ (DUF606 family)
VIYVASTVMLFPRLGTVVTVGLYIAGQMLVSLGLDTFGVLGVPRQPPQSLTIVGTSAVLAGAATIVFSQKDATSELCVSKLGWIVLALLAGAVLPAQGAINGLLRHDIGAPFVVGTIHQCLQGPPKTVVTYSGGSFDARCGHCRITIARKSSLMCSMRSIASSSRLIVSSSLGPIARPLRYSVGIRLGIDCVER